MQNKEVKLLDDILSFGRDRTVYGKKNDKVKVVAEYGHVLIVEGKKGRFPVLKKQVSEPI
jgi:hypothetical protein